MPAAIAARSAAKASDRHQQRRQRRLVAVGDRDHDERGQVVDHEHGEQEDPHPVRHPAPDDGQQTSASAVSVDMATPQPCRPGPPALMAR